MFLQLTIILLSLSTALSLHCPPGSFITSNTCKLCPKGSYQEEANQTSCIKCPPGTFHPFRGAISSQCIQCFPGTFAPAAGSFRCKKCPPGTDSRLGFSTCLSCGIGEQISFFDEVCSPCFFGLYRGPEDGENCLLCPDGKSTSFLGATSVNDCQECPPGQEGANRCTPCFPTFFRAKGMPGCQQCPAGSFTDRRGQSECQPCPKNTFKTDSQADTDMRTCRPCPQGTASVSGASFCRRINGPCPKTFFVRNNGDCEFCSKGFFRNLETNECERCPPNTVSQGGTVTTCARCGGDTVPFLDGSVCRCRDGFERRGGRCKKCRPGSANSFPSQEDPDEKCATCIKGRIAPTRGTVECTDCPDGLVTGREGATKCIPCPKNLFPDFLSVRECIDPRTGCPPDFDRVFLGKFGLTFICLPKTCPKGFFKTEIGCETCRPGYRVNRKDGPSPFCERCKTRFEVSPGGTAENCTKCKRGFVRNGLDRSKCVCGGVLAARRRLIRGKCRKCPKGTFNPGRPGTARCFKCPPGTFSKRGARECKNCPVDTFSNKPGSSRCKPCPSGTFSYGLGESKCLPFLEH